MGEACSTRGSDEMNQNFCRKVERQPVAVVGVQNVLRIINSRVSDLCTRFSQR